MVLRASEVTCDSSDEEQNPQNVKPSGFSFPQVGQVGTARV